MKSNTETNFILDLTSCQNRIYAFLMSLVADPHLAEELLQRTNVVLWEKSSDFQPGTSFQSWAYKVAQFEVMAYRKRAGRERHLFDSELMGTLALEAERQSTEADACLAALENCLSKLPPKQMELIRARHYDASPIQKIADKLGRSPGAVRTSLHRIRKALLGCIQQQMKVGVGS